MLNGQGNVQQQQQQIPQGNMQLPQTPQMQQQVPQGQQVQQVQQIPQQQVPMGTGQSMYPHTQLQVPPVNVLPLQNSQMLQPSPEQILQQNYQEQMGQGNNVPQQNPQINYVPLQPGQVTTQQVQQGMPQMQQQMNTPYQPQAQQQQMVDPQMQQQQQMQQGAVPLTVDVQQFPNVPQEVLQNLVDQAQGMGVSQQEVGDFVGGELQSMQRFQNYDQYQEYGAKMNQLQDALGQQYGGDPQQVAGALGQIQDNIKAVGGDAMLEKFQTDPAMLDPAVVLPFLKGAEQQNANPYADYLMGAGQQGVGNAGRVAPQAGFVQGQGNTVGGNIGMDTRQIQERIQQMYTSPQGIQMRTQDPRGWSAQMKGLADGLASANAARRQAI